MSSPSQRMATAHSTCNTDCTGTLYYEDFAFRILNATSTPARNVRISPLAKIIITPHCDHNEAHWLTLHQLELCSLLRQYILHRENGGRAVESGMVSEICKN